MKSIKVVIQNEEGLHSRPASDFCAAAASCDSRIILKKAGDSGEFDGKSILMVMCLGACQGDEVEITADGPDEEEALQKLLDVLTYV